jgi:hypothetical protein
MRVPRKLGHPSTSQAVSGLTSFRPGQPASFMVFRCAVIKSRQARSPAEAGGAPQGWQESNPQPAVLEAAALPLRHIPMQLKTARWGLPGERLLVERVVALSRSLPGRQCPRLQARRRWHAGMPFVSLAPDG